MREIEIDLSKEITVEVYQNEYGRNAICLKFNDAGEPIEYDSSYRLLAEIMLSDTHIGSMNVGYTIQFEGFPLGIRQAWSEKAGEYKAHFQFSKNGRDLEDYPGTWIVKEGELNEAP